MFTDILDVDSIYTVWFGDEDFGTKYRIIAKGKQGGYVYVEEVSNGTLDPSADPADPEVSYYGTGTYRYINPRHIRSVEPKGHKDSVGYQPAEDDEVLAGVDALDQPATESEGDDE